MSSNADPLVFMTINGRHDSHPSLQETQNNKFFSPFVAVCYTLNWIVGTGFLVLPWAFVQGGFVLTSLVLVIAYLTSNLAKDYLLEGLARAEAVVPKERDEDSLIARLIGESDSDARTEDSSVPLIVGDRLFEVRDLVRIFLGDKIAYSFTLLLAGVITSSLTSFTIFFSSSLVSNFPLVNHTVDFRIYTAIFASIVVPMSCVELTDQKYIQLTLTGGRVIMFILMISTVFLFPGDFSDSSASGDLSILVEATGSIGASNRLFNFSGFSRMFPIVIYAFCATLGIPGISHAVKDKKQLAGIFQSVFLICVIVYSIMGASVGWMIGDNVEVQSNLNWANFRGGTGTRTEDGKWENVAWWAAGISHYVRLFPALDVVSAFPLIAIALGNNYLVSVFGKSGTKILKENIKMRVLFRLLASMPPIVCAFVFQKVGSIVDSCGTLMILLSFGFPALIWIYSGITRKTHYSTVCTSSLSLAIAVFSGALLLFAYLVVSLIFSKQ